MAAVRLKCTSLTLLAVLVGVPASAQAPITLHGSPQGVTQCVVPDQLVVHTIGTGICPLISFQTHWKPGDGSPVVDPPNTLVHNLAHTHIECNLPEGGELSQPVTVPCRFQLFHTAGQIALAYDGGQVTNFTMDPPTAAQSNAFPVIGDPNDVVIANFHVTFDPSQRYPNRETMFAPSIQLHGWANLMFGARTYFDDGDTIDSQMNWTFWSMLDPTVDSLPEGEGTRVLLSTRSTAVSARDMSSGPWGAHLIEFRDALMPMWAPFSTPIAADAFSYTYGGANGFTSAYHLVCDNDYHAGIAGNEMTFVTATLPITGEPFNHDFVDPLKISQSQPPAGFPPGQHRCTAVWQEGTPDNLAIPADPHLGAIAAGEELFSLISFDVAIGPNPTGCDATCGNAVGASPVQPQPIVQNPPPPPPAPPLWVTVATTNGHDIQRLMANDMLTPVTPLEFRICQAGSTNCSSAEVDR